MKKIVSIILVVCSIFYMASAAQPSDDVMPLYEHLTGMSASLEINSIGYANAQATATAEPGYNVRVTLEKPAQVMNRRWPHSQPLLYRIQRTS